MPNLSDTISFLSHLQGVMAGGATPAAAGRLTELEGFGTNPGALRAKVYVPDGVVEPSPLVVVLHGCTQTADGYDVGSGWSQLADRHGLTLLFPEQQRQNNPNLCFNWFSPEDSRRDSGEALSIRQMIGAMMARHAIATDRVFVTGLSAGGAMAMVMLATYPEVFAGGAIIAGLPFGSANTVPQALERMRGRGGPDSAGLTALVRGASDHSGPWPTLSVWHGSADATVSPKAADAIIDQWRALHGVGSEPTETTTVAGYPHRLWRDAGGRAVIEDYSITGMAHGTPLDTIGVDGCGKSGAHMIEAKISSSDRICSFWGLASDSVAAAGTPSKRAPVARETVAPAKSSDKPSATFRPLRPTITAPAAVTGVGKVIEDALRSAGLMR
ncbi:extracellular catalytic domain type 1 short-chain-length polyhydroxyalkanoate depolymerase [Sphingomonas radiodurans]|uniref:extracellular catalytic domain type 1 short-chain-length polyhydroxyalkanoate depolymerase n=1 Tax=Sphingomonas radiodurans TaxID=2890321 RepID=UPI001E384EE2|nr:PHB depolymerase family esterase [Sphingomonas radiodurans]WBH15087.1 PHB depolymerase family esterase [Sphingomonas radiodurans]